VGRAMNLRGRRARRNRRETIGRLLLDIGGFVVPICGLLGILCWSWIQLFSVHPYIAVGAAAFCATIFLGAYLSWDFD